MSTLSIGVLVGMWLERFLEKEIMHDTKQQKSLTLQTRLELDEKSKQKSNWNGLLNIGRTCLGRMKLRQLVIICVIFYENNEFHYSLLLLSGEKPG